MLYRVALSTLVLFAFAACLGAATLPAGFTETQVASGINNPTAMAIAPDGRIFVAQQGGRLRVVKNGALLDAPFVTLTVNSSGERGLLGVAFDPDFPANHFVYVYYTATSPAVHNRVSRFTASGDTAAPGSETVLLDLNNLSGATNHNGGALHFGPDGKLYIAVGENANPTNSQTLGNLLGKILRINKDGSIPTDNPFFNAASGQNRAIWAYGLRNPFTFTFQRGTGRMFINDVGQDTWEEINDGVGGSNYGWPITEGATTDPRFRGPLFTYRHGDGGARGCAITGGAFYNPETAQFPVEYTGTYFFADYCNGWIRRFNPVNGDVINFASGIASPIDLTVTDDGSLWYLARGEGAAGAVYRVRSAASQTPPTAVITMPADHTLYSAGDRITYAGTGTDPEDGNLPASAFTWQVDFHHDTQTDPFIPATTGAKGGSFVIPRRGETSANVWYRIHLTVRDSGGLTHTTFHDVVPRTATIFLATIPVGLRVTLDGQPVTGPSSALGVVGILRTLGVISPQTFNGVTYEFVSWSDGGAATHEITTPAANTTYTARFRVRAGAVPPGIGLTGTYYDNADFTGAALSRIDGRVSFSWPGSPAPGIGADTFSVRWTGRVRAEVSGLHTFYTQSDDGVRLWINGVRLIDHWTDHGPTEDSGTVELIAGQTYDLQMDFHDTGGAALARLSWSAPGLAKAIVPQRDLYPYALLIAGSETLSAGDEAVRGRLEAAGYVPVVKAAAAGSAVDAGGMGVVLISSTIAPADAGTKFRSTIAPVVVWEPRLLTSLGMTGPAAGTDFGTAANQTRLDVLGGTAGHPLAAGLSGRVTVSRSPSPFTWAKPAAGAVVAARQVGAAGHALVFGYERGAAMAGLAAPGRRVGLFFSDNTPAHLTAQGWALFDAAVRWASAR
jgi:glucose/arabinose dehydrogenase